MTRNSTANGCRGAVALWTGCQYREKWGIRWQTVNALTAITRFRDAFAEIRVWIRIRHCTRFSLSHLSLHGVSRLRNSRRSEQQKNEQAAAGLQTNASHHRASNAPITDPGLIRFVQRSKAHPAFRAALLATWNGSCSFCRKYPGTQIAERRAPERDESRASAAKDRPHAAG